MGSASVQAGHPNACSYAACNSGMTTAMNSQECIQAVGRVSISIEAKACFTFVLEDFLQLPAAAAAGTNSIVSPRLTDRKGRKWWVEVYPDGNTSEDAGWVSLFVTCDQSVTTACTVTLMHRDGHPRQSLTATFTVMRLIAYNSLGTSRLISRDELLEHYCSSAGTVTLRLDLAPVRQLERTAQQAVYHPPIPSHVSAMVRSLCMNPQHADVTLVVDGERLPAHKCILCSRSDVFHAMFQHPMQSGSSYQ